MIQFGDICPRKNRRIYCGYLLKNCILCVVSKPIYSWWLSVNAPCENPFWPHQERISQLTDSQVPLIFHFVLFWVSWLLNYKDQFWSNVYYEPSSSKKSVLLTCLPIRRIVPKLFNLFPLANPYDSIIYDSKLAELSSCNAYRCSLALTPER